jgi:hypothetical protein
MDKTLDLLSNAPVPFSVNYLPKTFANTIIFLCFRIFSLGTKTFCCRCPELQLCRLMIESVCRFQRTVYAVRIYLDAIKSHIIQTNVPRGIRCGSRSYETSMFRKVFYSIHLLLKIFGNWWIDLCIGSTDISWRRQSNAGLQISLVFSIQFRYSIARSRLALYCTKEGE